MTFVQIVQKKLVSELKDNFERCAARDATILEKLTAVRKCLPSTMAPSSPVGPPLGRPERRPLLIADSLPARSPSNLTQADLSLPITHLCR